MRPVYEILLKPRLTEKGSTMAETANLVVFEVPLNANKTEIKQAVQSAFSVEVESVRTMVVRGKVRRRGRISGKQSNWKKAIVTVAEGQEIDLFGASMG